MVFNSLAFHPVKRAKNSWKNERLMGGQTGAAKVSSNVSLPVPIC